MTFIIVSQFESKDDFGSDPYGYYVELDGTKLISYGDDYHDDGCSKCQGFIDGMTKGSGITDKYKIEFEDRDDWKD